MRNWIDTRLKAVYQPNTLFNLAVCAFDNSAQRDEFAWKLIANRSEEKYIIVTEYCWLCEEYNLPVCHKSHKQSLYQTEVAGDKLKLTYRHHTRPVLRYTYSNEPRQLSCKRKLFE